MSGIEIGRLLRSGTTGFVVGCKVQQIGAPSFGAMVQVPLEAGYQVYGLIYDIHIDDDGLVRQLITAENISEEVLRDNRVNRTVPVEIGVLALGYEENGRVSHLLPPRPPLSLDVITLCTPEEVVRFTGAGRLGYLRHILRDPKLPTDELLAAHLKQARAAHEASGDRDWFAGAVQEVIELLKDDRQRLMGVLAATSELERGL
jgi:hypothetical protein